jgi:hypothetical protein
MSAIADVNQWSGSGPFATGLGNRVISALALSPDGKTVYSGTGSGTVFSYAVTLPTATTNVAAPVGTTSATLNATVNANNADTTVTFDYGTDNTYGSSIAATPATATGASDTPASAALIGLTPGFTFHYRVTAVSTSGTTHGNDQIFTLSQAASSTAISTSLNPSTLGQSVTFTATVTSGVGTPAGTVTFRDGTTDLGSGMLNAGSQATFTSSALAVGAHSLTAVYSGNTSYFASTSSSLTQTVNQAASSTSLVSSITPSTFGQSVTFTATVTSVVGTPTGTVASRDGTTILGSATLNASGQATFAYSALTVGTHSITAVYSGDTNFVTSTSTSLTQNVNQAASSTSLVTSVTPSTFGQSVTLTATVASGVGTPTGTVTFIDGAANLGSGTVNAGGQATCTYSALTVGTHSLTAVYSGDTNFVASTSNSLTQTVNQAASSTSLVSSVTPSTFGQSVTFTATVASGVGTPTGTVTFIDGAANLGSGTLNASGQATFASSALAVGTHSITAVYSGDTNFVTSTSSSLTQTVNKTSSTTTLVSSVNPSTFSQSVTFTATVTSGVGIPTGTVTFMDGIANLGSETVNASGQATFVTSALAVGTHSITTGYNGDTSYLASTSAVLNQAINGPPAITSATIANFTVGSAGSFTVTTTGYPAPALSASGSLPGGVTFTDNGNGTATLAGTPAAGSVGTYPLTFNANNGVGTAATQAFTLTVYPAINGSISINSGATYTKTTNVTLALTASEASGTIASMQFSNDNSTWTPWENYAVRKSHVLAAGDGLKTVYVQFKDALGAVSQSFSATITFDTTPPTCSLAINSGSGYTNSYKVLVNITAADNLSTVASMQFSSNRTAWSPWQDFSATKNYTLQANSAGRGNTVYAKVRDGAGNLSSLCSATITVDKVPPTGSIVINAKAPYTGSTSVTLALAAKDNSGSVASMQFSDNKTAWSAWEDFATTKGYALTSGAGKKTVYVRFRDPAGNISAIYSDSITLDTSLPTGSIAINSGAIYTKSAAVSLKLSATDASGIVSMRFSDDNSAWGPWEKYATAKSYTLPAGDGEKTVYVEFTDGAGNESIAYSSSITLDTVQPVDGTLQLTALTGRKIQADWSGFSDPGSGILEYRLVASAIATPASCSGTPIYKGADTTFTHTGLTAGKTYYYRVCALDNAKNLSTGATSSRKAFSTVASTTGPGLMVSALSDRTATTVGTVNIAGTVESGNRLESVTVNGVDVTGTEFTIPVTLPEGESVVTITASDEAGYQAKEIRSITLDKTRPLFTLDTPADNSASGSELIELSGAADPADRVEVSINKATPQAAQRKNERFSKTVYLVAGINTIEVSATDLLGNRSAQKRTVYSNIGKADLAVTDPPCDIRTAIPTITIKGSVSAAATTVTIEADGESYTPAITDGRFEQKITLAREESCRIKVTANRGSGDETTVIRNIIFRKAVKIAPGAGGDTQLLLDPPDQQEMVTEMQFSADGADWSVWERYASPRRAALTATGSVHVHFRDTAGNISPDYSDSLMTGK